MKRGDGKVATQIKLIEEAANTSDVKAVWPSRWSSPRPRDRRRAQKGQGCRQVSDHTSTPTSPPAPRSCGWLTSAPTTPRPARPPARPQRTIRPQGGTVAVFVGTASAANAIERLDGFLCGCGRQIHQAAGRDSSRTEPTRARPSGSPRSPITKHPDLGVMLRPLLLQRPEDRRGGRRRSRLPQEDDHRHLRPR